MTKHIKYYAEYYEINRNLVRLFVRIALCTKAEDLEAFNTGNINVDDFLDEECLEECPYYKPYKNEDVNTENESSKELETLRKELLHVLGVENLSFVTRHSIAFIKGDIFTREEVIKDVMKVVLLRFNSNGIAKETKAPVTVDKKGEKRKGKKKELNSISIYSKKSKKKVLKSLFKKSIHVSSDAFYFLLKGQFFIFSS